MMSSFHHYLLVDDNTLLLSNTKTQAAVNLKGILLAIKNETI